MRRFRYCFDPLFLLGVTAYAVNRWGIKPHVHVVFFHSWFNDLWLIPCALPPVLWLHRRLGLRGHDQAPQVSEIALHLVFWSLLFEWIGPHFVKHTTGDFADVIAYTVGAVMAAAWWNRDRLAAAASAKT